MKKATTVRERLIGKPLIGFDTKAAVRAPAVKSGNEGIERAPSKAER